jgi:hypothetical protein
MCAECIGYLKLSPRRLILLVRIVLAITPNCIAEQVSKTPRGATLQPSSYKARRHYGDTAGKVKLYGEDKLIGSVHVCFIKKTRLSVQGSLNLRLSALTVSR